MVSSFFITLYSPSPPSSLYTSMERICLTCNNLLPLSKFDKGKGKFGHRAHCRECRNDQLKEWRKNKSKEWKTLYYLKRKNYVDQWNINNPEFKKKKRKIDDAKKRAKFKSAGTLYVSSLSFLEVYNHKTFNSSSLHCEYCSSTIVNEYHLEHIVPLSKNGTNKLFNLAISCPICNSGAGGKHSKLLEEWKPELVDYINERNKKWN